MQTIIKDRVSVKLYEMADPANNKNAHSRVKALAALAELHGLYQPVSFTLPTLEQLNATRGSNERGALQYRTGPMAAAQRQAGAGAGHEFRPASCGSLCRLASLHMLRQEVLQPGRCRCSHVPTLQRRHAARKLVTLDNHKHHSGRGIANRSSIIQRAQPQGISSLLEATLRPVLVAGLFWLINHPAAIGR